MKLNRLGFSIIVSKNSKCKVLIDHNFEIVRDDEDRDKIKKEHPELIGPFWICNGCNKVTEST